MPEEKDYFSINAVSSHSLAYFEESPKLFKKKLDGEVEDEKKTYLEFGKQVHMRILEPKRFKQCYTVLNYELPKSEQQKLFCSTYIDNSHMAKTDRLKTSYTAAYSTKSKSDEKLLQEAEELYVKMRDYLTYLAKVKKYKDVLTFAKKQAIDACYNEAFNHKKAKELLFDDELKDDRILTFNELEILWKHPLYNVDCKSMIDRLIINTISKTIRIVDIKTAFSFKKFKDTVYEFNYDRQMAFYTLAIYWYMKNILKIDAEEYTAEVYLVVLNSGTYECKVIQLSDSILSDALSTIEYLFAKLSWHYETGLWEHTKDYYEGNGIDKL